MQTVLKISEQSSKRRNSVDISEMCYNTANKSLQSKLDTKKTQEVENMQLKIRRCETMKKKIKLK